MPKDQPEIALREYEQTDSRGAIQVSVSYERARADEPTGMAMELPDGTRAKMTGLGAMSGMSPSFEPAKVTIEASIKVPGDSEEQRLILPLAAFDALVRAVYRVVPAQNRRGPYAALVGR